MLHKFIKKNSYASVLVNAGHEFNITRNAKLHSKRVTLLLDYENINESCSISEREYKLNTLRPRKNGHHFLGDIFECIFLNENV